MFASAQGFTFQFQMVQLKADYQAKVLVYVLKFQFQMVQLKVTTSGIPMLQGLAFQFQMVQLKVTRLLCQGM